MVLYLSKNKNIIMMKLGDAECWILMKKIGIEIPESEIARNEEQAVSLAKKLGFPLVLKISSPDIIHKTDIGCVAMGVNTLEDVKKVYKAIIHNAKKHSPHARIEGVVVQKMLAGKHIREVIVGAKRDEQFGPVIMFGLGGIFVEIMKDVTFRLIPIQRKDAREMIREIKGFRLLQKVRNKKPVNFTALENVLLKVSRLMERYEKIRELDINPLMVDDKKAVAVDIRIMI